MTLKTISIQRLAICLLLNLTMMTAWSQSSIELRFLGRYSTNTYDAGGTEITAYDAASKRLFSVNGSTGNVDIINFTNPASPVLISSFSLAPYGISANSVAAKNGIIAIAVEAVVKQDSGKVVFIDAFGNFLNQVTAGALPDMITFTPDGNYVLVANEGEPNSAYTVDPEGSVTIINISGGVASATTSFARFDGFNSAAIDSNIRIFGPGSSVAQDLEPEYITVSANSQTAWVTCQENNAWAIIDIPTATVTTLKSMGFKNHNLPGQGLDASDQNGGVVNIANWPIKGMYMPDAISSYVVGGQTYILSANEGDVREYAGLNEALRLSSSSYKLDSIVFPNYASLKNNNNLGRLNVSTKSGDHNGDGFFEEIYAFGGRSFSIWNANGDLVWDSGDQIELIANTLSAANFNCSNTNNTKKNRSDDKGPEPEAATVATIGDSIYAFIGLERIGGIMVFNVTTPTSPYFVQYLNTRNFAQTPGLNLGADLGPEGVLYIPKSESPTGRDLLVVANEISGTISIFQIDRKITSNSEISLQKFTLKNNPSFGTYNGIDFKEAGFSGLHYIPGSNMEFLTHGDRGANVVANNNVNAGGQEIKFFPFPNYAPKIHRIKAEGDSLTIISSLELKRPGGTNATGLPNPPSSGGTGEIAWSDTSGTVIPPDFYGIDPEGIVEGNNNDIWMCDEYGASVWNINKTTGELINRYHPFVASANNISIDSAYAKRTPNRGFEGVAITPCGKVYAIIQSTMANPSSAVASTSRLMRILEIDPSTGNSRSFAYEHLAPIGGSTGIRNQDWKVGDLVAINNEEFLLIEHAERGGVNVKNIYKISLAGATPIPDSLFGGLTFEQLNTSANAIANGIIPVQKTFYLDLLENNWELVHDKPEGLTIINDTTIALVNDNDFGIDSPALNGVITATGKNTKMYVYTLPASMKLNLFEFNLGSISGPAVQCVPTQTGSATFSVPALPPISGNVTYNWSVPSGITILSGQGTPSIFVSWNATSLQTGINGQLCVTATNECGISATACQKLNINSRIPVATSSISGPVKACPGDVVNYSVNSVNRANSYNWTLPTGMDITNGEGTNVITVAVQAGYVGGTITTQAVNACGASPLRSKTLQPNSPLRPAIINGALSGVCGQSGVVYTTTGSANATSYQWNVPVGATITGGQGTNSIIVDFSNAFIGGTITVAAQNNCGSSATRNATINAKPGRPESVFGPTTICPSALNVAFSVATVYGASSYNWTVPAGAIITSGQGTKNITVDFGAYFISGQTVSVNTSNSCGTSINRQSAGIFIDTTGCAGAPTKVLAGISSELNAFPNPANNEVNISVNAGIADNAVLELIDLTGKTVSAQSISLKQNHNTVKLNTALLADGLYFIRIKGNSINESLRVTVKH